MKLLAAPVPTQCPSVQLTPLVQSACTLQTLPGLHRVVEPSAMVLLKLPPIITESAKDPVAALATVSAKTFCVPSASPYGCAQTTEPSAPESSAPKAWKAALLGAVRPLSPLSVPSKFPPMNTLPLDDRAKALTAWPWRSSPNDMAHCGTKLEFSLATKPSVLPRSTT